MHHGNSRESTGIALTHFFEWLHTTPLCGHSPTYYWTIYFGGIHVVSHSSTTNNLQINIFQEVALNSIWFFSALGQKCHLPRIVAVEAKAGWKDQTLDMGVGGPKIAAHTHLCHIEQEKLQVKGYGAGGHLVGNPSNAIAQLPIEWEMTSSAVLRETQELSPHRYQPLPPAPWLSKVSCSPVSRAVPANSQS